MADLATLAVELEARSARFDAQLKESRRQLGRLEKQSKRNETAFAGLTRAARSFAGVLAGGAVAAFAREQLQVAANLQAVTDRLEITSDTYQTLTFKARELGESSEVVTTSLQRLIRRFGDARRGVKEATDLFSALNLEIDDLEPGVAGNEELIRRFADAIQRASKDGTDLSLVVKALDTEGGRLVDIFNKGAQGLDQFERKARESSQILDDETIVSLAQASVAITNFSRAAQNAGAQILGTVITANTALGGELARVAAEGLLSLSKVLRENSEALQDEARQLSDWAETLLGANQAAIRFVDTVQNASGATDQLTKSRRDLLEVSEILTNKGGRSSNRGAFGPLDPNGGILSFPLPRSRSDGIEAQSRTLADSIRSSNDLILDSTLSTTSAMANAFARFAETGKLEIADLARSVSVDLLRAFSTQGLLRLLSGIGLGSLGAAGGVSLFASGGVINSPIAFPMGRGRAGIAGEAGPEAVLPLKQMASGNLGVEASAASSGSVFAPVVQVTVDRPQGGDAEGRAFGEGVGVELNRSLREMFDAFLRDASRPGGSLRRYA